MCFLTPRNVLHVRLIPTEQRRLLCKQNPRPVDRHEPAPVCEPSVLEASRAITLDHLQKPPDAELGEPALVSRLTDTCCGTA